MVTNEHPLAKLTDLEYAIELIMTRKNDPECGRNPGRNKEDHRRNREKAPSPRHCGRLDS